MSETARGQSEFWRQTEFLPLYRRHEAACQGHLAYSAWASLSRLMFHRCAPAYILRHAPTQRGIQLRNCEISAGRAAPP